MAVNFCQILVDHGTQHSLTVPHLSHQNGRAERLIRTSLDRTRTVLVHASLHIFWPYVEKYASLILNRRETPHLIWYGSASNLEEFIPFGCKIVAHIPGPKQVSKFLDRCTEFIYLGRSVNRAVRVVFYLNDRSIRKAKVLKYYSDMYPFSSPPRYSASI